MDLVDSLGFVRLFYAALASDAVDQGVAGPVGRVSVHEVAQVLGGFLAIAERIVRRRGQVTTALR